MATRKKTRTRRPATPMQRLYPPGTPVDGNGVPLTDHKIPMNKAMNMPLDADSARLAQQHREVLQRKASGERGVRWNADPRVRFIQCKQIHPQCSLAIKQVSPVESQLPGIPISAIADYNDLVEYCRKHWYGHEAVFQWCAYDHTQPQWAVGNIPFATDPERLRQYETALGAQPQMVSPLDLPMTPPPTPPEAYGAYPYGAYPFPPTPPLPLLHPPSPGWVRYGSYWVLYGSEGQIHEKVPVER